MANCENCGRVLFANSKCPCGWKASVKEPVVVQRCHFEADRNCKGKVSVRVNDSWLCNWHYENFYDHLIRTGEKIPALELRFKKKLDEVNSYIDAYRKHHPGTTKREACLEYMREKGIIGALPKHLQSESDAEAIAERTAIQAE